MTLSCIRRVFSLTPLLSASIEKANTTTRDGEVKLTLSYICANILDTLVWALMDIVLPNCE